MPRRENKVLAEAAACDDRCKIKLSNASILSGFGDANQRTVSNVIPRNLNVREGINSDFSRLTTKPNSRAREITNIV
jgi:hypothetical protein